MARQDTRHQEFRFTDGETFVESHRDTIGGWANMMARVEARFGDRVHPADVEATSWTVAGRTFTIAEVQTF